MVREDKRTLYVKMSHLEQISQDDVSFEPALLRNVIETKYLMVRNALNAAVPQLLGTLITMCGTVTRTTEVKPELLVGSFQCNECMREVSGVEQQFKVTMPALCPSRNCGNRTNWTLLGESRTTRWGDWQRVRLQENENEIPAGSMPRSMDVIVRDEMTERCKPGDKVLVTGR